MGDVLFGRLRDLQGDGVFPQLLVHPLQLQIDDVGNLFFGQGAKDHDAVETVEKFGPEGLLQRFHNPVLHRLVFVVLQLGFVTIGHEAKAGGPFDQLRTHVGRHDDDGVAEIDPPAFGIRQVPIFHNLQEHVEDFGVRLFDFVQEHHRIGAPAHRFGELATLLVANVSGRRTHQAADVVPLHEFTHVDLDECFFAAKQKLRQCFGQLRLTDTSRPQKNEGGNRTFGVLETSTRTAHGLGDGIDWLGLTNHALVEGFFHFQQTGRFFAGDTCHRDAGPHRHHFGNIVGADRGSIPD